MAYELHIWASLPGGPSRVERIRPVAVADLPHLVELANATWGELLLRVSLVRSGSLGKVVRVVWQQALPEAKASELVHPIFGVQSHD
jgi:hypothetical protein